MNQDLFTKPLWQMTAAEFLALQKEKEGIKTTIARDHSKKYVYGIAGIAQLFGCSIPTANRIKKSGKIKKAITQIGRKIIVDADLAMELAGIQPGGRK
jgi:hypothetical protein